MFKKAFIFLFLSVLMTLNSALALDFKCLPLQQYLEYKCEGNAKVTSMAELNNYLANYGLNKNKIKNLIIDFSLNSTTENLNIATPCQLNVTNGKHFTTQNLCLHGDKGVNIGDNFIIDGQDFRLESLNEAIIQSNSTINSGNLEFIAKSLKGKSGAQIKEHANVHATNLIMESSGRSLIGTDSVVVVDKTVGIYSNSDDATDNDDVAVIKRGASIQAGTLEISNAEKLRIAPYVNVNANEIILNATHCLINQSGTVLTAPIKIGSCFPNQTPQIFFTVDKIQGEAPLSINFNASQLSNADSFVWSFGDGGSATTTTALTSYIYQTPGIYTASLKYTIPGNSELKEGGSRQITVIEHINIAPVASINCTINNMLLNCNGLSSYDPEGKPLTYLFDFGDTSNATSVSGVVSHNYLLPGLYTVTLTVKDPEGLNATVITQVQALLPPNVAPTPILNCTSDIVNQVTCDAIGSNDSDGTILNYFYEYDDEASDEKSDTSSISHTFSTSGEHLVRLTVVDNDGAENFVEKIILVKENTNPVAEFTCNSPSMFVVNCQSSSYDPDSPNDLIQSYTWDLGNGETVVNDGTLSYQYFSGGNKTISLTVTDSFGGSHTQTQVVAVINNTPPVAVLNCTTNNLMVSCNALNSYDINGQSLSYQFNYGDGFSELNYTGLSSHAYSLPGTYPVTLTVTDSLGAIGTYTMDVMPVRPPNQMPIASLQCSSPQPFVITCNASGSIDNDGSILTYQYFWNETENDFKADTGSISHTYSESGIHNVKLVVTDNDGGVTTVTENFTVKDNTPPLADFFCEPNYENQKIRCNSAASDVDLGDSFTNYHWTLGDGAELNGLSTSVNHLYSNPGSYDVTLVVTDSFGATSSKTKNFVIIDSRVAEVHFQYPSGKIFENSLDQVFSISVVDDERINENTISFKVNGSTVASSFYTIDSVNNVVNVLFPRASYLLMGANTISFSVVRSNGATTTENVIYHLADTIAPVASLTPSENFHFTSQNGEIVISAQDASGINWSTLTMEINEADLAPQSYKREGNNLLIDVGGGEVLESGENKFVMTVADIFGNVLTKNFTYYFDPSQLSFDFIPPTNSRFDTTTANVSIYPVDSQNMPLNWSSLKLYWNGAELPTSSYQVFADKVTATINFDVVKTGKLKITMQDSIGQTIIGESTYSLRDVIPPVITPTLADGTVFQNNLSPDIAFTIDDESAINEVLTTLTLNGVILPSNNFIYDPLLRRIQLRLTPPYLAIVGENRLGVSVTDIENNNGQTSFGFTVIDNIGPQIAFTPQIGSSFLSNTNSVAIQVSDISQISWSSLKLDLAGVPIPLIFYSVSGNNILINFNPDFSFELGDNAINISLQDIWGNQSRVTATYKLLENRSPQIAYSPDRGTHFKTTTNVIAASFTHAESVNFNSLKVKLNSTEISSWVKDSASSISITLGQTVPLVQGANVLNISFTDTDGTFISDLVYYYLDDVVPPTLIATPEEGHIFSGQNGTINLTASDPSDINWESLVINLNQKVITADRYTRSGSTVTIQAQLSPDSNVMNFSVKDKIGNAAQLTRHYAVSDLTGPTFKFSPANWYNFSIGETQNSKISVIDPGGVNSNSIQLWFNGVMLPISTYSWSESDSAVLLNLGTDYQLKGGNNLLKIRAADQLGHVSETSVVYKLVDTAAPVLAFLPDADTTFTNNKTPSVRVSFSDNSKINLSGASFYLNGVKVVSSDLVIDNTNNAVMVNFLNQALHLADNDFRVVVSDEFGNVKDQTVQYSLQDTIAPQVAYLPASGATFSSLSQAVKLTFSDLTEVDWNSLSLKLNGEVIANNFYQRAGNDVIINFSEELPFVQGNNTIEVKVRDTSSNELNSSANYTLSDIFPANIAFSPESGGTVASLAPTIAISLSDVGQINYSSIVLTLNGTILPSSQYSRDSNLITLNLSDNYQMHKGLNLLQVQLSDVSGNVTTASASYFSQPADSDTILPVVNLNLANSNLPSTPSTIVATVSDASGIDFARAKVLLNNIEVASSHLQIDRANNQITVSFDQNLQMRNGQNTLTVYVTDNFNNVGAKTGFYNIVGLVGLDNIGPSITFSPSGGEITGNTPTIFSYLSDESGVNWSSVTVKLNDTLINSNALTIDQVSGVVAIQFSENFPLPNLAFNKITVTASDNRGTTSVVSVGLDKKSSTTYAVISSSGNESGEESFMCTVLTSGAVKCWGRNEAGQLGNNNTNPIGDNETPIDIPYAAKLELLAGSNPVGGFNGSGLGNKAYLGLNNYHNMPLSQFSNLSFKIKVPAVSPLNKTVYMNLVVDTACNPAAPDYAFIVVDFFFLTPGLKNQWNSYTFNSTQQVYSSVGGKGGLPANNNPSNLRGFLSTFLTTYPNACLVNASTGDNGQKKNTVLPSILFIHGDSATTAASQVYLDDIAITFNSTTDKYPFYNGNADGVILEGVNKTNNAIIQDGTNTVAIADPVKEVSMGSKHACAVTTSGSLYCWGNNTLGQVGKGNFTGAFNQNFYTPQLISIGGTATQVSAGTNHTCVLLSNGTVRCFGQRLDNVLGQTVTSNIGDNELPTAIPAISFGAIKAIQVSAGQRSTCALLENGKVKCWGVNTLGQTGVGNLTSASTAAISVPDVALPAQAIQIASSANNTCALLNNGKIYCWGANDKGQLGLGHTNTIGDNETPGTTNGVDLPLSAKKVSIGTTHACALLENAQIKCWGDGSLGQLGYGNLNNIGDNELVSSVGEVDVGDDVMNVTAGNFATYALRADGKLRAWGSNIQGALGLGISDTNTILPPSQLPDVILGEDVQVPNTTTIARLGAYFEATPYVAPAPSQIAFDASLSTGTITNYHWDFGGITNQDTTSPTTSFTFPGDGVYAVTLTVTDSNSNVTSFTRHITIGLQNNPPIASFSVLHDFGVASVTSTFDASTSFDVNGSIAKYSWDFNDGATEESTTPIIEHTYSQPGIYIVNLSVTDNSGAIASAIPQVVTVKTLNMEPFASFNCQSYGKTVSCSAYTSSDMDGTIADYHWDLGDGTFVTGADKYTFTYNYNSDGDYPISLVVTDNNGATGTYETTVSLDSIKPQIIASNTDNILTNDPSFNLNLLVLDAHATTTQVLVNGVVKLTTNSPDISHMITLNEGNNIFTVTSTDSFGNTTTSMILSNIVLDSTAPTLASINPGPGSEINTPNIEIKGVMNEQVNGITIDGNNVTISPDGKSFTYNYVAMTDGSHNLLMVASDPAGNSRSFNISFGVQLKILYPELIAITKLASGQLKVVGAAGSTKGDSEVKIASGFFNGETVTSNANGSFELTLDYFQSAKITVTDPITDRSETAQLSFDVDTTLAGTIQDTDGNPIPGVIVQIKDTDTAPVLTNSSGIFSFANPPAGDRQLIIDGQKVSSAAVGPNKKFSILEIPVSIGSRQSNVLENIIHLAPLIYDGSETVIESGVSATVVSTIVEGAEISIPASVDVTFPEGNELKAINMIEIDKSKTTVPVLKAAEPDTVVALEPSGLTFSEPVELTLPNPNNFPSGMQVMIYSKNSKTGTWEVDGIAKVASDGQSIVTQEGMGITHFSEVYAAPMGLKYSQINSQDKPGADTFNGAVATSINFPSYRSLGQEIAPKLLYRSNWAYPTATITNIFEIPNEVEFISQSGQRTLSPIGDNIGGIRTWVEPQSVDLTLVAGDYHSPKMTMTGIPHKAVVSLGVDFSNQNSGIIPFAANYEINLLRMVIRTGLVADGKRIGIQDTPVQSFPETIPQELRGNLYIQNKSNSNAGRGWMIAGVQKIVNPGNSRLMLEEDSGAVSTYVVNDKIQTLTKISEGFSGVNALENNQLSISSTTDEIYSFDLQTNTRSSLATAPVYAGTYYSSSTERRRECASYIKIGRSRVCFRHEDRIYCQQKSQSYKVNPSKKHMISSPSGGYIIASENGTIYTADGHNQLKRAPNADNDILFCSNTATCWGENTYADFRGGCPSNPESSGEIANPGFLDGNFASSQFNSIKSIAASHTQNGFAVADYGNHRVRFVNQDTKMVSTIAGNGKLEDTGDGGPAIESSLYHPRGVAYDEDGNLYVTTENGYIRKIDTSGRISHFAGNPNGALFDEAPAKNMYLSRPYGLAIDNEKNYLYVADTGNNRVIRIDLITNVAKNVAGNGLCQTETNTGELGAALGASLCNPEFVTIDNNHNLIVADTGHKMIRRVIFSDSSSGLLKYDPVALDNSSLIRNTDGTFVRTLRNGTKFYFNSLGRHSSTQDRVGRIVTNAYDAQGKLLSQTDPVGGLINYHYSGNRVSSISYDDGREFFINYGTSGDLESVIYPDGTSKNFAYDPNGLLTTETDQRNHSTVYTYNEWKRLKDVTRPDGNKIVMNDSTAGNMANNYTGGTTGAFKHAGVEANQLVDGIKDAKNITTSFIKDETGYVSTIIDGANRVTTVERDLKGRPTKITRPDESIVQFVYDQNNGDLLTKTDSSTGTSENYIYDAFGNLLSKTDGQGRKITKEYDSRGLVTRTINEILGTTNIFAYDSRGLMTSKTDSLGQTSTVSYDPKGNAIASVNPDGKETHFTYFDTGFVSQVTDANSKNTLYEYDEMNRLTAVVTPDTQRTEYTYFETGELKKITDPNGKETKFFYDNLGQLTQKIGTRGETTQLAYDPNGNISQETDPKGQVKTFEYDNLDQLARKVLPDDVYDFVYDARGNVTNITNNVSEIELTYQHFDKGDVVSQVRASGRGSRTDLPDTTINYQYNEVGEKIGASTPVGHFTYTRDAAGRLRHLTNHKGEVFDINYDLNSRVKNIAGPAVYTSVTYDTIGFNSVINHTRKSSGATIEKFIYGRDLVGNRVSKQTLAGTAQYSYDDSYQLTQSIVPTLPTENFAYDSVGNQTNNGQIYDDSKQELQEDANYIYAYDELGNLISKQEKAFTGNVQNYEFDSENKMRIFKLYKDGNLATEAHYVYDALGRRIEKEVIDHEQNSTAVKRFVYDGAEILAEMNENNEVTASYTHSTLRTDDVLAVSTNGSSYFYIRDGIGSITDVTDSSGFKIQHIDYSAFGKILKITNASGLDITSNPIVKMSFAFTSREIDSESNLYYFRARFYDSSIGRFISSDPDAGSIRIPKTLNSKYIYCANNPLNSIDPTGMKIGFKTAVAAILLGPTLGTVYLYWHENKASEKEANRTDNTIITAAVITGAFYVAPGAAAAALVGTTFAHRHDTSPMDSSSFFRDFLISFGVSYAGGYFGSPTEFSASGVANASVRKIAFQLSHEAFHDEATELQVSLGLTTSLLLGLYNLENIDSGVRGVTRFLPQ